MKYFILALILTGCGSSDPKPVTPAPNVSIQEVEPAPEELLNEDDPEPSPSPSVGPSPTCRTYWVCKHKPTKKCRKLTEVVVCDL